MPPAATLAVITGGLETPPPFFRPAAPGSIVKAESATRAMAAVTLAHAAALLWLAYHPVSVSPQPVLSFTVTLMDVSASENSVSTAASAASMPSATPDTKETVKPLKAEAPSVTPRRQPKPVAQPSPKANAPLSHASEARTAVLAPITPARFDAAYLNNPKPSYPALSRRLGEQGSVLLSVFVNENGRAENVTLKSSSGFDRLDNAALEAVSRWRFAAARQGEKLIASWVNVPVKFVLE